MGKGTAYGLTGKGTVRNLGTRLTVLGEQDGLAAGEVVK